MPHKDALLTAEQLRVKYGYWGKHPEYPLSDWRSEVANNETREGYWDWVEHEFECATDEEENESEEEEPE